MRIYLILSVLALGFLQGMLSAAEARSIRFYGKNGMYQGRISSMGNIYNRDGFYSGRIRR